jgi:carbon-monoxide dehydrogenase medium subunit
MYDFEVLRPATLAEAVAALRREGAQALAGGQTLIPTLRQRLASPEVLVSLGRIPGFGFVREADGWLCLGAGTTHAEVARGAAGPYPALAALAGQIGDPAVRNRGTCGGSLANNDPSACWPAAVLASDAVIVTDRREIAAADWFQGMFTTALDEGELVTEIRLRLPERAAYQKFAQPASRFALVGVFVARHADGVRVAVTGAAEDGAFRWGEAEAALEADFSAAALAGLALPAEGMIADMHGTAASIPATIAATKIAPPAPL